MEEERKDIFIKLENPKEFVAVFKRMAERRDKIRELLSTYNSLYMRENDILDSCSNYLEDITQRLEHVH